MRALAIAALIALAAPATVARAAETPIPPAPTAWVTDPTGFLSDGTRAQLDYRLRSYQQTTGHQVIVWIGSTLGGAPLEDWSANAFRAWGIGQKGKDDGVALFVFRDDRKLRIEVGYGLEDKLPDAYAGRIVHEVMEPALKQDHADTAVTDAVDQILARLGGEGSGAGVAPLGPQQQGPSTTSLILGIIGVVLIVFLAIRHPTFALWLMWTMFRGGGGGNMGGGGGGFSGGGGRSGGGGASGGW